MITQEAVLEFQTLYQKEYGININKKRALEYGTRLINLVKAVYGSNLDSIFVDKLSRKRDD